MTTENTNPTEIFDTPDTEITEPSNDIFDMDDDEVMGMSESDFLGDENQGTADEDTGNEGEVDDTEADDLDGADGADGGDSDLEGDESEGGEELPSEDDEPESESDEDDETEDDDVQSTEANSEAEKELAKLLAPFKANGREISVKNVDEAITLMQKGANYNKKMAALKPAFKVAKMLENNKLLDESTVSYLIDLHNGNPDAIAKLIKDAKFDVDNFDVEKDSQYVPTDEHTVSDESMALDEVLAQIRETPTYQATMNVVGNEWDAPSKDKLVANPEIIAKLNEHMGNGVYQKIADEMARQEALGVLPSNLSNLDAYFQIGNQLMAAGAFGTQETPSSEDPLAEAAEQAEAQRKAKEQKRRAKKKAATQPRPKTQPKQPKQEFNPFDMDDDAYMKEFGNQLY